MFGSHQDADRPDNLQTHAMGEIAGSAIIQDDSVLTLHGQRNCFGFAIIDQHFESSHDIGLGG